MGDKWMLRFQKREEAKVEFPDWNFAIDWDLDLKPFTHDVDQFPYWPSTTDDPEQVIKRLHQDLGPYDSSSYTLEDDYKTLWMPIVLESENITDKNHLKTFPPAVPYVVSRIDTSAENSSVGRARANLRLMCNPVTWRRVYSTEQKKRIVDLCKRALDAMTAYPPRRWKFYETFRPIYRTCAIL
jgi:hypothetical protein